MIPKIQNIQNFQKIVNNPFALNNILKYYLMLFLLMLYYRKQINYDLSDYLHASVTELRHICISKRWAPNSKITLHNRLGQ